MDIVSEFLKKWDIEISRRNQKRKISADISVKSVSPRIIKLISRRYQPTYELNRGDVAITIIKIRRTFVQI